MPWTVRKIKPGVWGIFKKKPDGSLKKVGESDSREKAQASVRAREANTND